MKVTIACGQFAPAAGRIAPRMRAHIAAQAREARAPGGRAARAARAVPLRLSRAAAGARPGPCDPRGAEIRAACRVRARRTASRSASASPSATGRRLYNSMVFIDETGAAARGLPQGPPLGDRKGVGRRRGQGSQVRRRSRDAGAARGHVDLLRHPVSRMRPAPLRGGGVTLGLVGSAWFGPAEEWELAAAGARAGQRHVRCGAAVQGSFGTAPFHGGEPHRGPARPGPCPRHARAARRSSCAEYDDEAVEILPRAPARCSPTCAPRRMRKALLGDRPRGPALRAPCTGRLHGPQRGEGLRHRRGQGRRISSSSS